MIFTFKLSNFVKEGNNQITMVQSSTTEKCPFNEGLILVGSTPDLVLNFYTFPYIKLYVNLFQKSSI
jgi:hypothetical protein